CSRDHTGFDVW
nr:immunoglobulin heavy chain junction region [Macaca mulatta]